MAIFGAPLILFGSPRSIRSLLAISRRQLAVANARRLTGGRIAPFVALARKKSCGGLTTTSTTPTKTKTTTTSIINSDRWRRLFHSEAEFHRVADETLEGIENAVEDLSSNKDDDGVECNYSSGVLTIVLGDHGTWVINKQTPNRQLWWSSPISGPKRFEYVQGVWAYTRRDGGSEGSTNNNNNNALLPSSDEVVQEQHILSHVFAKEIRDLYGVQMPIK